MVYVKARLWEEEEFLILKKCFIIVFFNLERQKGHVGEFNPGGGGGGGVGSSKIPCNEP